MKWLSMAALMVCAAFWHDAAEAATPTAQELAKAMSGRVVELPGRRGGNSITFGADGTVEREVETRRSGTVKSTGVWKAKDDGTVCLEFQPNPALPGAKNSYCEHWEKDGERIYLLDSRGQRTKESLPVPK